jgi:hypothetical protein
MDIQTAGPLVPEPSLVKMESPGIDQILAKEIKAGGEILCSEICKLIHSIWNKEEFPQQWKEYIIVPIHKKVKGLIVIIIEESSSYLLPTKF